MVRRLHGKRPAKAQSLFHPQGSGRLRNAETRPESSRKKGPPLVPAQIPILAWARAKPTNKSAAIIARELAALYQDRPCSAIRAIECSNIVTAWRARYARNTVYTRRWAFANLLKNLEEYGAPAGIHLRLPIVPGPVARKQIATQEEIAALLAAADPATKTWILLISHCGFRGGEAIRVTPSHYNPTDQTITINTKHSGEKTAPVSEQLQGILESLSAPEIAHTPVVDTLSKRHLSYGQMLEKWHTLLAKAGIPTKLRPHDLRRTSAQALWRSSRNLSAVQALLGHSSIRSTAWYLAQTSAPELRELMQSIWHPSSKMGTPKK
jgi:integrase